MGSIGDLIAAAEAYPKFPAEAVRTLNEMQADGDMHSVVDDAETDWLSY